MARFDDFFERLNKQQRKTLERIEETNRHLAKQIAAMHKRTGRDYVPFERFEVIGPKTKPAPKPKPKKPKSKPRAEASPLPVAIVKLKKPSRLRSAWTALRRWLRGI